MNPEIEPQKFYRNRPEKELGGVCGVIAEYFRIDPSMVQIAFAILTIAGGQGILLYLLMWAIVPPKKISRDRSSQRGIFCRRRDG